MRQRPISTLFPYTTLFRSVRDGVVNVFVAHSTAAIGLMEYEPGGVQDLRDLMDRIVDRKSTRLNSSHEWISYAVFCLKKKNIIQSIITTVAAVAPQFAETA